MTKTDLKALSFLLASILVFILGLSTHSLLIGVISYILASVAIIMILSQAYDEGGKNRK